jgi:hypothetical protein
MTDRTRSRGCRRSRPYVEGPASDGEIAATVKYVARHEGKGRGKTPLCDSLAVRGEAVRRVIEISVKRIACPWR